MRSKKFTGRDIDIMQILWDAPDSMTALEIVNQHPDLTMNTVQAVLRKLLKHELVKINRIVYSGTVLSRSFAPAVSSEEFVILQMKENVKEIEIINKTALVAALFKEESDPKKTLKEIEELELFLEDYKKSLASNKKETNKNNLNPA